MSGELHAKRASAVQLLDLRDQLDHLDEELRHRTIGLVLVPVVVAALAVPLFIALLLSRAPFAVAFMATLVAVMAAIVLAMTKERRRLRDEREALRERIRLIETG